MQKGRESVLTDEEIDSSGKSGVFDVILTSEYSRLFWLFANWLVVNIVLSQVGRLKCKTTKFLQ